MVSIAASQAVDPGSIPGRRMFWHVLAADGQSRSDNQATASTIRGDGDVCLYLRASRSQGVGGIMVSIAAFQAVDPGLIPGRRIFWLVLSAEGQSHSHNQASGSRRRGGRVVKALDC